MAARSDSRWLGAVRQSRVDIFKLERSCPVGFAGRLPRSSGDHASGHCVQSGSPDDCRGAPATTPRDIVSGRPRNSGLFVRHGAVLPRHRRHRARWPSAGNKGPFGHRSAFSDRRARVSRARFLGGCDQLRVRRFDRLDIPSFLPS
jgi:hypothetical protein